MAKFQTKAFLGLKPVPQPENAYINQVAVPIEFPSTSPAANDLIEVVELPAGVRCVDWAVAFPDVDSGGAPAAAYSLGVENAGGTDLGTEVWGTGLTGGQTGSTNRASTSASATGDVSASRKVALKCTAASATYAGSGKVGYLLLSLIG